MDDLQLLVDECLLKGYSQKTIDAYVHHVSHFLESKLSARDYLLRFAKGRSVESVRAACFAIKFFLKAKHKDSDFMIRILHSIPNMKREKKLPVILSKSEVQSLIEAATNTNHKLIIMLGYSAGLRVSEIINLRWSDIDFSRDIIHIKQGKGNKDRIVMLSCRLKASFLLLDQKTKFVFMTRRKDKYTVRTVQVVLKNCARKAGVKKHVTPHSLRHSFATHLLENGTDIRYIKELLGHADVRTTLIYTKVSGKDILKIRSPLD